LPDIYLGGTKMLRHGLGANGSIVNPPGAGWGGSYGVGFTLLFQWNVTVVCPDGSYIFGRTEFSAYGSNGMVIEGCAQENGATLVGWGKQWTYGWRQQFAYSWYVGRLAPGAHTINSGVYVEAGTISFDGNAGGTSLAWEMPN
jgi:hypothetical protein